MVAVVNASPDLTARFDTPRGNIRVQIPQQPVSTTPRRSWYEDVRARKRNYLGKSRIQVSFLSRPKVFLGLTDSMQHGQLRKSPGSMKK